MMCRCNIHRYGRAIDRIELSSQAAGTFGRLQLQSIFCPFTTVTHVRLEPRIHQVVKFVSCLNLKASPLCFPYICIA